MLTRRTVLASSALTACLPGLALAAPATQTRLVVILLRGAMDGLNMVIPVFDPAYVGARGALAIADAPLLDGQFGLHPAMPNLLRLFRAGQALAVHAVATPYRDRSHFDAQNLLETGAASAFAARDGWLNRALAQLPGSARGVALTQALPLILRGDRPAATYAPSLLPDPPADLVARLSTLYADDALLAPLWAEAVRTSAAAGGAGMAPVTRAQAQLPELATLAARLLAAEDGARIAVLDHGGWDSHAAQNGRLTTQATHLDGALGALEKGLGPLWRQTAVLAITEFGRTVAVNGTMGTDHGTATAALLAGGAVRGGRIIADWPGLRTADLHEGRDLRPTADLRSLIKGALAEHLGLARAPLDGIIFPDSAGARPLADLIRA